MIISFTKTLIKFLKNYNITSIYLYTYNEEFLYFIIITINFFLFL